MLRSRALDPENPYASLKWGIFDQEIRIGNQKRRMLTYIPDGARPSTSGILVLGPNGKTADELLENSGWCELADQDKSLEKFIVFFLEPQDGYWKTWEKYGTPDGDLEYVNVAFQKCTERLHYCVHESKFYLFGVEEGGTMAHMAAMNAPAIFAGVATISASEVSASFREKCQQDFCFDLNGIVDPEARQGRKKGDIPVPVWIIENLQQPSAQGTLQYWMRSNNTEICARQVADDTIEYPRVAMTEYPLNQEAAAYHVWKSTTPDISKESVLVLVRRIWYDFLSKHRRWMGDPGGDLRLTRDPVSDIGMEYHTEIIDGWQREWYVYVPERVKKAPEKMVPLVLALHGYSCTGEIYIGNTNWHHVAKDRGFIVVYPSALPGKLLVKSKASDPQNIPLPAWNFLHNMPDGPNEFAFFQALLERVCTDHPIDPGRVFVTGHSHGSMMTQALSFGLSKLFAAAAPCSGVIFEPLYEDFIALPDVFKPGNSPVPIWMFVGNEEQWAIDPHLRKETSAGKTFMLWYRRNGLPGHAEEHFEDMRITHSNRWHDLICCNANHEPMLQYTTVDYFPHATIPEMSYRIWDEFFSCWSRSSSGVHYHKLHAEGRK